MEAFIIWSLVSGILLTYGIFCICSKSTRPFGFWSNVEMFEVTDVKGYNRATGKLFIVFAIGLELLGLPLLNGQNSSLIIFTIIGTMFLAIICMAVYTVGIEPKYRVK